jgi:50S ribosomal subunit-associated GTPase HflX
MTNLLEQILKAYEQYHTVFSLLVPYSDGAELNKIYEYCDVIERTDNNDGTLIQIKVESRNKPRMLPIIQKYSIEQ